MFFLFLIYLFIIFILQGFVCVDTSKRKHMRGSQRTVCRHQFCPSTLHSEGLLFYQA